MTNSCSGTQILAALQVCKSPLSFQNRISAIRQHDKDVAKYLTWTRPLTQTFSALTAMADDEVLGLFNIVDIYNALVLTGWSSTRLAQLKWEHQGDKNRDCCLQQD